MLPTLASMRAPVSEPLPFFLSSFSNYLPQLCRPVILPDYSELEFRISDDARSPALVALDGKVFTNLEIGDSGET